jgi:hypothetical protein
MSLYGYQYPEYIPMPPVTTTNRFDAAWLETFPNHAQEYRVQLDLLSTHLNMGEEEKRHRVAVRIRAHAIQPENWDACNVCHISERMDNGF